MTKKWVLHSKTTSPNESGSDLDPTIVKILTQRGVAPRDMNAFLDPQYERDTHDPYLFDDMEKAVERIIRSLKNKERITIYGDYDVDGVGASTVLHDTLTACGANVHVYMNHRERDGYGMQIKAVEQLAEEGTTLIITNDSGISNKKEIAYAKELGMDTIITDHHQVPPPDDIPDAYAIIHPQVRADRYPFKYLAGGGSAFKLAQGLIHADSDQWFADLREHAKNSEGKPIRWDTFEKWLLDAVCLSTIGDCVPLVGENRVLVKYGLIVLAKTRRPGLRYILKKAGFWGKPVTPRIVSFTINPRINAASRMEHGTIAFRLMTASSDQEGMELADILEQKNSERQKVTERILSEASKQLKPFAESNKKILVGISDEWNLGVLGLVAGKLCNQFNRPVVLATRANGHTHGTARSIERVHITNTFHSVSRFFEKFGGHAAAGGFLMKEPVDFHEFRTALEASTDAITDEDIEPSITIDVELTLAQVTWSLWEALSKLEPFGEGNRKPLFLIQNVSITDIRPVGTNNKHLRLVVQQHGISKKVIAFSLAKALNAIVLGDRIDIVCEIGMNEWNGTKELQISLVDYRRPLA
ncbi:MAG: single-stranded-DNA-specific exonuclease RecJ [bacterium]|nr:single-stranded-DNA-specific exonuclease RecJ [bacterium]